MRTPTWCNDCDDKWKPKEISSSSAPESKFMEDYKKRNSRPRKIVGQHRTDSNSSEEQLASSLPTDHYMMQLTLTRSPIMLLPAAVKNCEIPPPQRYAAADISNPMPVNPMVIPTGYVSNRQTRVCTLNNSFPVRRRFHSTPSGQQDFCTYCRSTNQENPFGHSKWNCPVLARMAPCQLCHASGHNNHTIMYCPENKTHLKLNPYFDAKLAKQDFGKRSQGDHRK